jgi:hypothetical protein
MKKVSQFSCFVNASSVFTVNDGPLAAISMSETPKTGFPSHASVVMFRRSIGVAVSLRALCGGM